MLILHSHFTIKDVNSQRSDYVDGAQEKTRGDSESPVQGLSVFHCFPVLSFLKKRSYGALFSERILIGQVWMTSFIASRGLFMGMKSNSQRGAKTENRLKITARAAFSAL